MKRVALALGCIALLLSQTPLTPAQDRQSAAPASAPAPLTLDHGGKIDAKYDGFAYETIVTLKKMKVNCGDAKGFKDIGKDMCVSLSASLHCPGKQLDYVRGARLQLVFETKDWYARHPLGSRELVVVVDGETIRLGKMALVTQGVGDGLVDDKMREVLEVSFRHETFERIAQARNVEMKVGGTAFALREKNVAALRDLNNRVRP